MSVGFVVQYSDGTSDNINMDMAYSIFPLTVTFGDREVSSIESCFLARMNTDVDSYEADIKVHTELYKKPSTTPADSSTVETTKSGSDWHKGSIEKVASYTVTGERLNTVMGQYGNGNYLLQVSGAPEWGADAIALTAIVNGEEIQLTANPNPIGLDLTYSDGSLQSATLSITQPSTPLSIVK